MKRPSSAVEAVEQANQLLQQYGLRRSEVLLVTPANEGKPFAGAAVEIVLSQSDLQDILSRVVVSKVSENGGTASPCTLQIQQRDPQSLHIKASTTVKMMMATVQVTLSGDTYCPSKTEVGIRNLTLDTGSGMFSSMAGGMIRPRIAEYEGKSFSLAEFTGMPIQITQIQSDRTHVRIGLSVE